ncbi:unnamed protein product [Orchesella dallaii]|uniref:Methyl farnesoate epoxidase n=1 Tax=Orchesella dallaii TaxID=48710 RepID=A0ABP1QQQ0_9HEXA
MVFLQLIAVFTVLLGVLMIVINRKPKNYPKGPLLFPLLGSLPQMMWHSQVQKLPRSILRDEYRRRYGKVYSMKLGPFPVVVLTDHNIIREAWNNLQICGRPKLHGAAARTNGVVRGILFQDGEEWQEQRRFALRHLRDFGFGKRSMENLVMDEVTELIKGFRRDSKKPISTQTRFNVAVLNSLWSIVAGERYSHDDPILQEIIKSIHRSLEFRGLVFFFPWLKDWFPKLSGWEEYMKCMPLSYEFLSKFVKDRLAAYDGGEPEHFTDVFINEIRRTTDPNSSFYKERGEATLIATLLDLFVAGIETTSTSLTYTLLYLALFPEKQKKLQAEIDRVVGTRLPTFEDRKRMPYTEATIQEVLRFSSLVPTGLIHKTLTDVTLGGFNVPKNHWVMANLQGVHHDPEIWGDPENFRPERFLSENGEEVVKHEALLPFSFGKRVCLGESLARDELFLFITGIFQAFDVETDPNSPRPTTEQLNSNIIAIPKPHQLVLKERH